MSNQRKGTPVWVWVGLGCLLTVVLGASVLGVGGYFAVQKARELRDEMRDPAVRESAVLEILGVETIPEGYHAMVGFSVPFLMKMAILSDREPDEHGQGGFDERGFIYFELLQRAGDRNELRDYFEGRTDDASVLREHDIRIDAREVIGRGSLDQPGRKVLWLASRGRVQMARAAREGLTALTLIECEPRDNRGRLGIWFGPDPDPDAAPGELELAGTPADPDAIDAFLAPFSLCPA